MEKLCSGKCTPDETLEKKDDDTKLSFPLFVSVCLKKQMHDGGVYIGCLIWKYRI